jgi:hypothetical protein
LSTQSLRGKWRWNDVSAGWAFQTKRQTTLGGEGRAGFLFSRRLAWELDVGSGYTVARLVEPKRGSVTNNDETRW